jgi:hypothetical protein
MRFTVSLVDIDSTAAAAKRGLRLETKAMSFDLLVSQVRYPPGKVGPVVTRSVRLRLPRCGLPVIYFLLCAAFASTHSKRLPVLEVQHSVHRSLGFRHSGGKLSAGLCGSALRKEAKSTVEKSSFLFLQIVSDFANNRLRRNCSLDALNFVRP